MRIENEENTVVTLNSLFAKIENTQAKSGELQTQLREQRNEMKNTMEKLNSVLSEMQAIRLRYTLLFGGGVERQQISKHIDDQMSKIHSSIKEQKNSLSVSFPMVSAPMQNSSPKGMQITSIAEKSFPNGSWKPKEPPVFQGKSIEDVHSWTEVVSHYFMFMQGTPQQEVAYAVSLLRGNAHDWFMAYLRQNQGRYPCDWATLSTALIARFGSRLREKQALANIMAMRQNRRSVRDYAAEFENCVGKLLSYDEGMLLQLFIWGLEEDLAEKVSTAHPKTLLSAISITEDLELAIRFAHRSPMKGDATSSSKISRKARNGQQIKRQGVWRWGQGGGREGQIWGRFGAGGDERAPGVADATQMTADGPTCFYCGDLGHFVQQCPIKPNATSQQGQIQNGAGRGGGLTKFRAFGIVYNKDVDGVAAAQQHQIDDTPPQGN